MEDFILREIDRLGEMLLMIARRLGLLDSEAPDYSLADVKDEFDKAGSPIDLDTLLQRENPVWYLMEDCKLSACIIAGCPRLYGRQRILLLPAAFIKRRLNSNSLAQTAKMRGYSRYMATSAKGFV